MPLVIIIALIAVVVMYLRFRAGRHMRQCRWREDRAAGNCHCVTCGARVPCKAGELPKTCQKPESDFE